MIIRKQMLKMQRSNKSTKKHKAHIKTEKQSQKDQRTKGSVSVQPKGDGTYRQTSMLYHHHRDDKLLDHSSDSARNGARLPDIYNPTPQSMKVMPLDKAHKKGKNTSSVVEGTHRLRETYGVVRERGYQSGKKALKVKVGELQPLKQMNKEEKNKIFKIIRTEFQDVINSSNHMIMTNAEWNFRAYVEKGNNGLIVKELLKKRWWWHIQERDMMRANLVWTQWFNRPVTENMMDLKGRESTIADDCLERNLASSSSKQSSIKKVIDDRTFFKIKPQIASHSNTYLKKNRDFILNFDSDIDAHSELKSMKVQGNQVMHNHVDGCLQLHSKKLLWKNFHSFMKKKGYNPVLYMPETFYIDHVQSPTFDEFLCRYDELSSCETKNIWICKPGENSNRGHGITVLHKREQLISDIKGRVSQNTDEYIRRTVIVQKYMENPFLINNRKFDIRCFVLLTTVNGILKGYWYYDGYIRTSSEEFTLTNLGNAMVHLTNDAVQKKGEQFGRFENQNKMTFEGFKQYLGKMGFESSCFDQAYQKMKQISYYMIASVSSKIKRKQYTFELFGLDFMLDHALTPFLIEANSNPSLENSGKIMGALIHELIDNVIMTAIDPIFPSPVKVKKNSQYLTKDYFESNKFELIFTDDTEAETQKSKQESMIEK